MYVQFIDTEKIDEKRKYQFNHKTTKTQNRKRSCHNIKSLKYEISPLTWNSSLLEKTSPISDLFSLASVYECAFWFRCSEIYGVEIDQYHMQNIHNVIYHCQNSIDSIFLTCRHKSSLCLSAVTIDKNKYKYLHQSKNPSFTL